MKLAATLVGIVCVLLGGLWLLQGLGIVQIPPLLCVTACEPIEGGSTTWAATGALVLVVGVLALTYGVRRR